MASNYWFEMKQDLFEWKIHDQNQPRGNFEWITRLIQMRKSNTKQSIEIWECNLFSHASCSVPFTLAGLFFKTEMPPFSIKLPLFFDLLLVSLSRTVLLSGHNPQVLACVFLSKKNTGSHSWIFFSTIRIKCVSIRSWISNFQHLQLFKNEDRFDKSFCFVFRIICCEMKKQHLNSSFICEDWINSTQGQS